MSNCHCFVGKKKFVNTNVFRIAELLLKEHISSEAWESGSMLYYLWSRYCLLSMVTFQGQHLCLSAALRLSGCHGNPRLLLAVLLWRAQPWVIMVPGELSLNTKLLPNLAFLNLGLGWRDSLIWFQASSTAFESLHKLCLKFFKNQVYFAEKFKYWVCFFEN